MSISSISLADLRALPHISVSQIRTFLGCPKRYGFQYIERREPAFRPIAMVFGKVWHKVLAHHLSHSTREEPVPRQELHELFRQGLATEITKDGIPVLFDDEHAGLASSTDLGLRMLDTFLKKVPLPDKVLGVEVPFLVKLAHPVTGERAPVPFIGVIDAVVMEHGAPALWELKSSARRWSADQIDYDMQVSGYSMAAHELGREGLALKLVVTLKSKTPEVQIERLVRGRADAREFAETTLAVLRAIRAGIDYRIRGWACKSCAYAAVCGT